MTLNDPRYLDATGLQMMEEYWSRHYDDLKRDGKDFDEDVEDEDFDQDEIERLMAEHPDDWMERLDAETVIDE